MDVANEDVGREEIIEAAEDAAAEARVGVVAEGKVVVAAAPVTVAAKVY